MGNCLHPATVDPTKWRVTTGICYRFGLEKDDCARYISTLSLQRTPLSAACSKSRLCNTKAKYRSIDGSCNNVENPNWGSAMTAYARILFPQYFDGKDIPYRVTISIKREKDLSYHISHIPSPFNVIETRISPVYDRRYARIVCIVSHPSVNFDSRYRFSPRDVAVVGSVFFIFWVSQIRTSVNGSKRKNGSRYNFSLYNRGVVISVE